MSYMDMKSNFGTIFYTIYKSKEYDTIEDYARIWDDLCKSFCDAFEHDEDSIEKQEYERKCKEVALHLVKAIEVSSLSEDIKNELKNDLKDVDYFTLIYVLGKINALLYI